MNQPFDRVFSGRAAFPSGLTTEAPISSTPSTVSSITSTATGLSSSTEHSDATSTMSIFTSDLNDSNNQGSPVSDTGSVGNTHSRSQSPNNKRRIFARRDSDQSDGDSGSDIESIPNPFAGRPQIDFKTARLSAEDAQTVHRQTPLDPAEYALQQYLSGKAKHKDGDDGKASIRAHQFILDYKSGAVGPGDAEKKIKADTTDPRMFNFSPTVIDPNAHESILNPEGRNTKNDTTFMQLLELVNKTANNSGTSLGPFPTSAIPTTRTTTTSAPTASISQTFGSSSTGTNLNIQHQQDISAYLAFLSAQASISSLPGVPSAGGSFMPNFVQYSGTGSLAQAISTPLPSTTNAPSSAPTSGPKPPQPPQ